MADSKNTRIPQAEKAIRFLVREGGLHYHDAELVFASLPVEKQHSVAFSLDRIEWKLEDANRKVARGRRGLPV